MAKRRKAKSSPNKTKAIWHPEDQVKLLAWLEFSRKHKHLNISFDETIVTHLDGAFTRDQIDKKLYTIWGQAGQHNPGWDKRGAWRAIKYSGISVLYFHRDPNENWKVEIALAVATLERTYRLEDSTPNRRLRGSSRAHAGSSNQNPRLSTPVGENKKRTRGQKRKFGTESLTPSEVKFETGRVDNEAPKTDKTRKIARTYSKRNRPRSIRATACSPETSPFLRELRSSPRARETRSATIIKDSEDSISDALDVQLDGYVSSPAGSIPFGPLGTEDSDTHRSPVSKRNSIHSATVATPDNRDGLVHCKQCELLHPTECLQYLCQECIESDRQNIAAPVTFNGTNQVESSTETDDYNDPRLQSAVLKISELQESLLVKERELDESEQNVQELNREIHYLNMARKLRDEQHGSSVEEVLVKQLKQVHNLRNDLQARHRLGTFTTLLPASRFQGTTIKVENGLEDTYHNCHMIFRRLDIKQFPCIPQFHLHESLSGLVWRVIGLRQDPILPHQDQGLTNIDPVALLRSLSAAALQEWVFESDFPSFEDDSSITLATYRDLLAKQDGALALRNLDLATFKVKITSPEFCALIVPKEAQRLAIKLSQAFAPFFTRNLQAPEAMSWDGFATWGHETKIWRDRQDHLVKTFTGALTTKARSCLNIEDYEMVIYAPGTAFDSKTMEAEKMNGTPDAIECEGRVVQICLQAAHFVHARRPVPANGSVSESIIPTKNFVTRSAIEREGLIPSLKAVVVLAETSEQE